jgi:diguanylate cyclase (GGDEF)-like protein
LEPDLSPDAEAQQALWASLDGSGTGVALFDAQERLRLANRCFLEAFATTLDPAPTWEEMLRHCHRERKGLLIDSDDIDAWIAKVRRTHRQVPVRNFESDLTDGRWISVSETLRPDGWVLVVAADVTPLKANEATLRQARDKAVVASLTDPLTNLYNRRFIFNRLGDLLASSRDMRMPLTVAAIDLDHFKLINDNHGHGVGDQVLKHFAQTIRKRLRPIDLVGRIGGEEFLVLLPNAEAGGAAQALARLRDALAEASPVATLPQLRVTFSAGLSTAEAADGADQIYHRVDRALYAAKAAGRNCSMVIDTAGAEAHRVP